MLTKNAPVAEHDCDSAHKPITHTAIGMSYSSLGDVSNNARIWTGTGAISHS